MRAKRLYYWQVNKQQKKNGGCSYQWSKQLFFYLSGVPTRKHRLRETQRDCSMQVLWKINSKPRLVGAFPLSHQTESVTVKMFPKHFYLTILFRYAHKIISTLDPTSSVAERHDCGFRFCTQAKKFACFDGKQKTLNGFFVLSHQTESVTNH